MAGCFIYLRKEISKSPMMYLPFLYNKMSGLNRQYLKKLEYCQVVF